MSSPAFRSRNGRRGSGWSQPAGGTNISRSTGVEPYTGNEAALGFDLASNAARSETLETARDSGAMVASSAFKLVQDEGIKLGFLIFAPVYQNGHPPAIPEQVGDEIEGGDPGDAESPIP